MFCFLTNAPLTVYGVQNVYINKSCMARGVESIHTEDF